MALPSVSSASRMAPPTARAGSSREQPWADRAPWGPQSNQGSWAQQGGCAGSRYAARRANLRCSNSFGAVALTAQLGPWRSTMPETVALAILRFGSRCNRAIWINSGCWERSHLGWVAKGLGALARGPNQAAGQRPGVSDLWHSPLCYCWS